MPTGEPLGILIVAARQSLRQAIGARARGLRLTTQQFWAIYVIRTSPGATPGELGHLLLLDAPAASRLVAQLVERELVEMRPDRDDRRRTRLHLTEKGEALGEDVGTIVGEFQQAVVRGFSDDEVALLRAGLRRVVENLAGFGRSGDAAPRGRSTRRAIVPRS